MSHQKHPKEFLVGAIVGSLLGGVSALLAAPSSGDQMRKDIKDQYDRLHGNTQSCMDSLAEKGKCLSSMFGKKQSCDWTDCAKDTMSKLSNGLCGLTEGKMMQEDTKDFLIGGIIGGVLGAVAGLLLAPKAGEELRHDIADTYHHMSDGTQHFAHDLQKKKQAFAKQAYSRSNKWLSFAKHLIDELSEGAQEKTEEFTQQAKDASHNSLNSMIEMASLGFQLWQKMKK